MWVSSMGDVRLSSPRVRVIREGCEDLELQTANPDMIAWDLTRPKQRPPWPKFDEAPFMWLTFLAWHAARRTGAIDTGYTFERWRDEVLEVANLDETEGENDEAGRPTLPDPGPDSS